MFKKIVVACAAIAIALPSLFIVVAASSTQAEARSMSRSMSSYRSTRSYKPKSRPVVRHTTVNKTTVIQQNHSSNSGGGLMSTIAGSAIGSVAGSYIGTSLAQPDEPKQNTVEQVQPQPQSNQVCPQGYACDFDKGVVLKLPQ